MFELIADKNRERSVELSRILQREVCKATGVRMAEPIRTTSPCFV
jgi:N-acetylmuramoyl-L-alanine amidase